MFDCIWDVIDEWEREFYIVVEYEIDKKWQEILDQLELVLNCEEIFKLERMKLNIVKEIKNIVVMFLNYQLVCEVFMEKVMVYGFFCVI